MRLNVGACWYIVASGTYGPSIFEDLLAFCNQCGNFVSNHDTPSEDDITTLHTVLVTQVVTHLPWSASRRSYERGATCMKSDLCEIGCDVIRIYRIAGKRRRDQRLRGSLCGRGFLFVTPLPFLSLHRARGSEE